MVDVVPDGTRRDGTRASGHGRARRRRRARAGSGAGTAPGRASRCGPGPRTAAGDQERGRTGCPAASGERVGVRDHGHRTTRSRTRGRTPGEAGVRRRSPRAGVRCSRARGGGTGWRRRSPLRPDASRLECAGPPGRHRYAVPGDRSARPLLTAGAEGLGRYAHSCGGEVARHGERSDGGHVTTMTARPRDGNPRPKIRDDGNARPRREPGRRRPATGVFAAAPHMRSARADASPRRHGRHGHATVRPCEEG